MRLFRALYLFICIFSIAYFLIFGFVIKKLPKITISYEDVGEYRKRNFDQRLQGEPQGKRNDRLKSDVVRPSILTTKAKYNSRSAYADPDNGKAILEFLSNLGNKDRKSVFNGSGSSPTEDEEVPTLKPVARSSGVALGTLMDKIDLLENMEGIDPSAPCVQAKRVGRLLVEKKALKIDEAQKLLPFVSDGGRWKPENCLGTKVAIVIPFRDREFHLAIFLKHIHRFLRWQLLNYRIFVIEQSGVRAFNRGMLMNIGFVEAMKRDKYKCVIFHDIDLLPEDDRNDYNCPSSPRHMSTAVDTMKYKLQYKKLFGGVEAFWPEDFRKANGFPNRYWGWGGEDDDLYVRVQKAGLGLTRPVQQIGRYYMMKHKKSTGNPLRHSMLRESRLHVEKDGLNSLEYEVLSKKNHHLYTMIVVEITQKGNRVLTFR